MVSQAVFDAHYHNMTSATNAEAQAMESDVIAITPANLAAVGPIIAFGRTSYTERTVNVNAQGAPGDGTDQTTALQAAITDSIDDDEPRTFDVPRGVYGITQIDVNVGDDPDPYVAPTNLFTSTDFENAAWTEANCTVYPHAILAPDGTNTGFRLVESLDGGSTTHQIHANVSVTSGTTYTWTIYVNTYGEPSPPYRRASCIWPSAQFSSAPNPIFDTTTGTITSGTGTIEKISTYWYKCTSTAACTSTGTAQLNIRLRDGNNSAYTGDGESGFFFWGPLFEVGAVAGDMYDPDPFTGRVSEITLRGESMWTSTLLGDSTFENLLVNNAGRLTIENLHLTQNYDMVEYDSTDAKIFLNSDDEITNDVTIRNSWISDIGRQGISWRFGKRWQVIGNRAENFGREFIAFYQTAGDAIVALNHVRSVPDDTFAFSSDRNVFVANHATDEGPTHHVLTGGGLFKCRGSYNVMVGNLGMEINAWLIHYWCSVLQGSGGTVFTAPTGNIVSGNVFKTKGSIRWDHYFGTDHEYGCVTTVPIDNAINMHANNYIEGQSWIDAVVSAEAQDTGSGVTSPDTGGTFIWFNETFVGMRNVYWIRESALCDRIIFRQCRFHEITEADVVSAYTPGDAARTWSEVTFEDCEFSWATAATPGYIVNLPASCGVSITKLTLRRNRVISDGGVITGIASIGTGSTIGTVIDDNNDWITPVDKGLGTQASQPASGSVAVVVSRAGPTFKMHITLTAARITVTDAAGSGSSGSLDLWTFGQGVVQTLGSRATWSAAAEGAALTGGANDAAFVLAFGSVAADAGDGALTGTEINFGGTASITLPATGFNATVVTAAQTPLDGTSTAITLRLNFSGTAATIDANSTIDVTGTFTLVGTLLGDD